MTADAASQTLSAVELLSKLPAEEVRRLEAAEVAGLDQALNLVVLVP